MGLNVRVMKTFQTCFCSILFVVAGILLAKMGNDPPEIFPTMQISANNNLPVLDLSKAKIPTDLLLDQQKLKEVEQVHDTVYLDTVPPKVVTKIKYRKIRVFCDKEYTDAFHASDSLKSPPAVREEQTEDKKNNITLIVDDNVVYSSGNDNHSTGGGQ